MLESGICSMHFTESPAGGIWLTLMDAAYLIPGQQAAAVKQHYSFQDGGLHHEDGIIARGGDFGEGDSMDMGGTPI